MGAQYYGASLAAIISFVICLEKIMKGQGKQMIYRKIQKR